MIYVCHSIFCFFIFCAQQYIKFSSTVVYKYAILHYYIKIFLCAIDGFIQENITNTCTHKYVSKRINKATVISACWATVDWSWPKMWNWCVQADLHLKKKKGRKKSTSGKWIITVPKKSTQTKKKPSIKFKELFINIYTLQHHNQISIRQTTKEWNNHMCILYFLPHLLVVTDDWCKFPCWMPMESK